MTIPGEFFQFPPNPERGQRMTAQERAENIVSQWVGHKVSINGQRDDIAAAIEAAVADMTRCRDNAVEDMGMWMERAGKLAGGVDVATLIREAVAEERERCAKIVEDYDETNEDGEQVNPGLGYWVDVRDEYCYIPDAEAIAARIREPKRG